MPPTTQICVFARPQMSGGISTWTLSSLLHSFFLEISCSHMALITIHVLPTTNISPAQTSFLNSTHVTNYLHDISVSMSNGTSSSTCPKPQSPPFSSQLFISVIGNSIILFSWNKKPQTPPSHSTYNS